MSTLTDNPLPNGAPRNAFYENLHAFRQGQQVLDSGIQDIADALNRSTRSVEVGHAIVGAIDRVADSISDAGKLIARAQNRLADLKAAEVGRKAEHRWATLLPYVDHNGEFVVGTAGGELLRKAARGNPSVKSLVGSRSVPAQTFANLGMEALAEFGLGNTGLTEHDFLMFHAVAPYVLDHAKARQPWDPPKSAT